MYVSFGGSVPERFEESVPLPFLQQRTAKEGDFFGLPFVRRRSWLAAAVSMATKKVKLRSTKQQKKTKIRPAEKRGAIL
jgi:hypothetical protein